MKKFLIKSGIFIALIFAILGMIVIVTVKSPANTDHYNYAHTIKMERLDTLSSPRIIFVGGSNVAFGLNSERISDSLGINVQNAGVHAGIGLRYMLSEVGARVCKGDIVVIMPEYVHFDNLYDGDDAGTLTDAVVYNDFSGWSRLNRCQIINVILGFPDHIKGRRVNFDKLLSHSDTYTYTSRNFNEYGDESAHRKREPQKLGILKYAQSGISENVISDVAEKVRAMESKGANVIFIWPTSIETNYNANKEIIGEITEAMGKYGISFATTPDYLVEPDSLAYDTPYHMSGPAVEDVTDKIIKRLKESSEKLVTGAHTL